MPFLEADDLALEDFIGYIQRYHELAEGSANFPLMLTFSAARAVFSTFILDEPFFIATDQGRIFSPEGELKWRRVKDLMRVVYLGHVAPPEGLKDRSSEVTNLKVEIGELLLWGTRTDTKNEWIEQQMPNRFDYPIQTAQFSRGRAVITIEHWLDEFGFAQFNRYHSLKEAPGETNAAR